MASVETLIRQSRTTGRVNEGLYTPFDRPFFGFDPFNKCHLSFRACCVKFDLVERVAC